ncbi:MAG: sulfite exporter TauE/SafE family protein [Rhizobiaceae bacterium]
MTTIVDTVTFDAAFWLLAAIVFVAGAARGMSGFGTGMIIAPVAGALYGPQVALAVIVLIDSLPSIPVTIPALKIARWREVLPVVAGIALLLPAGVYLVRVGDPVILRWAICVAILACVAVLWSGWRYGGPRNTPVSLAVGGVAGVLSGIASIPGPPVIFYWMSAGLPAVIVRANLLALFLCGEFLSIGNLWWAGLFTREALGLSLFAAPPYFLGLIIGARLFGLASEAVYRRVTFMLIVISALLALPPLADAIGDLVAATPT